MLTDLAWMILLAWCGLATVLWRRRPPLVEPRPHGAQGGTTPVSVVVAARNEESRVLGKAITSMLAQDYPSLEVVAVDDRSTDGTGRILDQIAEGDSRLLVIHGQDLPPGWSGKPHAIAQAVNAATGEWLLATDADILFAPSTVMTAITVAMEQSLDVLSLWPRIDCQSFWERLILPVDLAATTLLFPLARVNDPRYPDAMTIGGFILMRREALVGIGGYRAIRKDVAEDTALGHLFKAHGYRLHMAYAPELLHTRDYASLAQIWEGLTRKLFSLLAFVPLVRSFRAHFGTLRDWRKSQPVKAYTIVGGGAVAAAGSLALLTVLPPLLLVWGLVRGSLVLALPAALSTAFAIALHREHGRRNRVPAGYSWLAPVGYALFAAAMLHSTWEVLRGRGLSWRGRRVYEGFSD